MPRTKSRLLNGCIWEPIRIPDETTYSHHLAKPRSKVYMVLSNRFSYNILHIRESSQSAPEYSLSLEKPPTVNIKNPAHGRHCIYQRVLIVALIPNKVASLV